MLITYFAVVTLIATAYIFLIIYILEQWNAIEHIDIPNTDTKALTLGVSIIIPARNESQNILACINSILANDNISVIEPQIIVIDDHSSDNTVEIVRNINSPYVQVLSLKIDKSTDSSNAINAYKKAAINYGLKHCKNDFIIQFDADTIVPPKYLSTILNYQSQYKGQFLAAPVKFEPCNKLIHHFQQLDIIGMMAVTGAGIQSKNWYMANGANMCYMKKKVSFAATDIASGDDTYAIQNIAQSEPEAIYYIKDKNAIVTTAPIDDYRSLYQQRIRWATKNKLMKGYKMQVMMLIPFINALVLMIHIPLMIYIGLPAFIFCLFHITSKLMIDYLYLRELSDFFDTKASMKYFLVSNIMHVIYLSGIGFLSLFVKKYNWKGRSVH